MKKGPLNFKKNYKALTNFSMVYFIFMGIIVGVTAFNFGTIARYRVPALPFLFAGIFSMHLAKRYKKNEYRTAFPAPYPRLKNHCCGNK